MLLQMIIQSTRLGCLLLLCFSRTIITHPQAPSPDSPPPVAAEASPKADDSFVPATTSNTTSLLNDPSQIFCFRPEPMNPPVTIESCRPVLNSLKDYPDYARKQVFIEGDVQYPKHPHTPPFVVNHDGCDCSILIAAYAKNQRSYFSFRDARSRAQEILQHCEDVGMGRGGSSPIGVNEVTHRKTVWAVTVLGKPIGRPGADGGRALEDGEGEAVVL